MGIPCRRPQLPRHFRPFCVRRWRPGRNHRPHSRSCSRRQARRLVDAPLPAGTRGTHGSRGPGNARLLHRSRCSRPQRGRLRRPPPAQPLRPRLCAADHHLCDDPPLVRSRLGLRCHQDLRKGQGHRVQRVSAHREGSYLRRALRTRPGLLPQHRTDLGEVSGLLGAVHSRAEEGLPCREERAHRLRHGWLQPGRLDNTCQGSLRSRSRCSRAQYVLPSRHGREGHGSGLRPEPRLR
mmetsp:Transcript_20962/g.37347  ORF Transcript_20962/g.37347 Transcript_20962/m.37347 type:complete len:237 (-) Transcript_20962:1449-2159(-)